LLRAAPEAAYREALILMSQSLVISLEKMNQILEIDPANQIASSASWCDKY